MIVFGYGFQNNMAHGSKCFTNAQAAKFRTPWPTLDGPKYAYRILPSRLGDYYKYTYNAIESETTIGKQ